MVPARLRPTAGTRNPAPTSTDTSDSTKTTWSSPSTMLVMSRLPDGPHASTFHRSPLFPPHHCIYLLGNRLFWSGRRTRIHAIVQLDKQSIAFSIQRNDAI